MRSSTASCKSLWAMLGLLMADSSVASGQISFEEPRPIAPNIVNVQRPHVSDVDGNGTMDVILGSNGKGRIVAFEIDGDTVRRGRELIHGHVDREQCWFADINGDGYTDIVTGRAEDHPAPSRPVLFLNDGQGTYSAPIFASGGGAYDEWQILTADLDGDNAEEIVHLYGSNVRVWRYNTNSASLEAMVSFSDDVDWKGAAVADLDNDGINELLLSKWYWVGYWDPTSGGTSLITIAEGTGTSSRFLPPIDLDGDGRIDVAMHSSPTSVHGVARHMQQEDGTFLPGSSITFPDALFDIKLIDADDDGLAEFWGSTAGGIQRIEMNLDFTIASLDTVILDPAYMSWFVVQDVQGDGVDDVLAVTMDDQLLLWEGGLGSTFDGIPQVLYEWPHELASRLTSIPSANGGGDLCMASGAGLPYLGAVSPDFAVVSTEGSGFDRMEMTPLNLHEWHRDLVNSLLSVDMDGDGDMDVLGCDNIAGGAPCILYGMEFDQPTDHFTLHCIGQGVDQSLPTVITGVDVIDVNGDGHVDILVKGYQTHPDDEPDPSWNEYFDRVLFRTDDWVYEVGAPALPPSYYSDHADLDGDGDEDLVVQLGNLGDPQEVTVYRNLGSGQYEASATATFLAAYGSSTAFADVDGDGRLEFLRSMRTASEYKLFFYPITMEAISEPILMFNYPLGVNGGTYAVPSDFDLDGHLDLLVVDRPSFYEYTWSVFRNDGEFPLVDGEELYRGGSAYVPFLCDDDGDEDNDLIMQLGPCLYRRENISPHVPVSIGSFAVYPNPTAGDIVVDLGYYKAEILEVEVFDVTGRLVMSAIQNATVFSMGLGKIGHGVYVLRINSKETAELLQEARVVLVDRQ